MAKNSYHDKKEVLPWQQKNALRQQCVTMATK